MDLKIELFSDGTKLSKSTTIGPGTNLRIQVKNDGARGINLVIRDTEGNIRLVHRSSGDSIDFETKIPQTRSFGEWSIEATTKTSENQIISGSTKLTVAIESKKTETSGKENSEELSEAEELLESEVQDSDNMPEENDGSKNNEEETKDGLDDEVSEESIPEDATESTEPLSTLSGVGKATEKKLVAAGIVSINQLAASNVEKVVEAGVQSNQAAEIIKRAKEFLS